MVHRTEADRKAAVAQRVNELRVARPKIQDARRRAIAHTELIDGDDYGMPAPISCRNCSENGAECRIYGPGFRKVTGIRCSRCRNLGGPNHECDVVELNFQSRDDFIEEVAADEDTSEDEEVENEADLQVEVENSAIEVQQEVEIEEEVAAEEQVEEKAGPRVEVQGSEMADEDEVEKEADRRLKLQDLEAKTRKSLETGKAVENKAGRRLEVPDSEAEDEEELVTEDELEVEDRLQTQVEDEGKTELEAATDHMDVDDQVQGIDREDVQEFHKDEIQDDHQVDEKNHADDGHINAPTTTVDPLPPNGSSLPPGNTPNDAPANTPVPPLPVLNHTPLLDLGEIGNRWTYLFANGFIEAPPETRPGEFTLMNEFVDQDGVRYPNYPAYVRHIEQVLQLANGILAQEANGNVE